MKGYIKITNADREIYSYDRCAHSIERTRGITYNINIERIDYFEDGLICVNGERLVVESTALEIEKLILEAKQ